MSSVKRKMPATLLQRRVRPRYEPEPESDIEGAVSDAPSEETVGPSESEGSEDEDGDEMRSGSDDEENSDIGSDSRDDEEDEEDEKDGDSRQIDASQLTFGALARAQASLGSSSRRQRGQTDSSKPASLETKSRGDGPEPTSNKKPEKPPHRTSKHAPVEMSSKKPVSRKREFLTVTAPLQKKQPRDPRFMPVGGGAPTSAATNTVSEIKARKAYAFLDEYRESEMQQLRDAIKKTKDPVQREALQRALMSMESRKKAQERKDRERAVIEEHRKQEKELVKQGKKPFYLKRSERKKRVLVEQFQGLKKKQVDKVIERRRKKIAAKEKKLLPVARRGVEDR